MEEFLSSLSPEQQERYNGLSESNVLPPMRNVQAPLPPMPNTPAEIRLPHLNSQCFLPALLDWHAARIQQHVDDNVRRLPRQELDASHPRFLPLPFARPPAWPAAHGFTWSQLPPMFGVARPGAQSAPLPNQSSVLQAHAPSQEDIGMADVVSGDPDSPGTFQMADNDRNVENPEHVHQDPNSEDRMEEPHDIPKEATDSESEGISRLPFSRVPIWQLMGFDSYTDQGQRLEYLRRRRIAKSALEANPALFKIGTPWSAVETSELQELLISKVQDALGEWNYHRDIIERIILSITQNYGRQESRAENKEISASGGTVKAGRRATHGRYAGRIRKGRKAAATPSIGSPSHSAILTPLPGSGPFEPHSAEAVSLNQQLASPQSQGPSEPHKEHLPFDHAQGPFTTGQPPAASVPPVSSGGNPSSSKLKRKRAPRKKSAPKATPKNTGTNNGQVGPIPNPAQHLVNEPETGTTNHPGQEANQAMESDMASADEMQSYIPEGCAQS